MSIRNGIIALSAFLIHVAPVGAQELAKEFGKRLDETIKAATDGQNAFVYDDGTVKGCSESADAAGAGDSLPTSTGKSETLIQRDLSIAKPESYATQNLSFKMLRMKGVPVPGKYDLIAWTTHYKWSAEADEGQLMVARRYLVKKGEVIRIDSGSQDSSKSFVSRLEKLIEDELKTAYSAPTIKAATAYYPGISKPPCKLSVPGAEAKLKDYVYSGSMMEAAELEKRRIGKTTFWFGKADPVFYIKGVAGEFHGYYLDKPLEFEFRGNTYSCYGAEQKRDVTDPQQRAFLHPKGKAGLIKVAKVPALGQLYRMANDPAVDAFHKAVVENHNFAKGIPQAKLGKFSEGVPSKSEFEKQTPIVYVADPLDRVYRCEARSLKVDLRQFVEPLIYIYTTTPRTVSVRLSERVRISASDPEPKGHTWTVETRPSGSLFSREHGKFFGSLFWAGRGVEFPEAPEQGRILHADDVSRFLDRTLRDFGLNDRETNEFLEYWVPILTSHKYVLIDFLVNEEVTPYAALETEPVFTKLRIYLNYQPVENANVPYRKKSFPRMKRPSGDLLVEWGGASWPKHEIR